MGTKISRTKGKRRNFKVQSDWICLDCPNFNLNYKERNTAPKGETPNFVIQRKCFVCKKFFHPLFKKHMVIQVKEKRGQAVLEKLRNHFRLQILQRERDAERRNE